MTRTRAMRRCLGHVGSVGSTIVQRSCDEGRNHGRHGQGAAGRRGAPPAGGTLVPGLASRLPMEPIVVRPGVLVPDDALRFHAVRSSGPGGQNVNKVASKVELRVDLRLVTGLD